jgi:serine/threonine protein kinase
MPNTLISLGANSEIYRVDDSNEIIKVFINHDIANKEIMFMKYIINNNIKCCLIPNSINEENHSITMKRMTPLSLLPYDTLSEKNKLKVIRGLITSIMELHSANIVHNDLKPDNILYDPITLSIKLIDFSSSFFEGDPINNATTPKYNSPDHIKSKMSDIWSLGIILSEFNDYAHLSSLCLQNNRDDRPSAKELLQML